MDAVTITWYRFLVSAILLFVYIKFRSRIPAMHNINGSLILLLIIASLCLCGNYIVYLLGLDHLSPNTAQVIGQLSPVFLLLGSLVIYKEKFSLMQWCGLIILLFGLGLFFNQRLLELMTQLNSYTVGVLFIITSGLLWATYGLAQKQLLQTFSSEIILLFLYTVSVIVLLPITHPETIARLNIMHVILLAFCALNTLFAYGSFAEALNHWEASRISAVLATTPIFTLLSVHIGASLFPEFIRPDPLNFISLAGALLVVGGSMLSALGRDN